MTDQTRIPIIDRPGNGESFEQLQTRALLEASMAYVPPKLTEAERLILTNGIEIGLQWAHAKACADMKDHGGRPASDFAERLCRDMHQSEYIAKRSVIYRGRL